MFVFLMHYKTSTWEKLVDIKNFPAMGGAPEMLEKTSLSDWMQTFINGIQSSEAKEFSCNYEKDEFIELKKLENKTEKYSLWIGGTKSGAIVTPTGDDGKFTFEGQLSTWLAEGDVNGVMEMMVSIAPSTPIEIENE